MRSSEFRINAIALIGIALLIILVQILVNMANWVDHQQLQQQCLTQLALHDYVVSGSPVAINNYKGSDYSWLVGIDDGRSRGATLYYDRNGACVFQGAR